jgi:hypothetical protein
MPDTPPFQLTQHAALVTGRRRIDQAWIAATIADPAATEPDRQDPALLHALRPIPDFDSRVLRVVYNASVIPPLVITAYFDRLRRGTL